MCRRRGSAERSQRNPLGLPFAWGTGFPSKARGNEEMIGRRIAKYHGKTLRHGYVNGYIPPVSGKAEPSWTVRYGEDEGKDEVEEVDGPELERQLDLQQLSLQTAGWDPSPVCDYVVVRMRSARSIR